MYVLVYYLTTAMDPNQNNQTVDRQNSQSAGSVPVRSNPAPVINQNTSQVDVLVKPTSSKKQTRDSEGRFVKKDGVGVKVPSVSVTTSQNQRVNTGKKIPDFMNFKITNPLVYIKAWWKKIMRNEGAELKIKIKPVTAIALAIVAFSLAFGLGGVVFPFAFPWMNLGAGLTIQQQESSPTPVGEWKETALKGTLRKTTSIPVRFYLLTSSDEAVTLQAPNFVSLDKLVGKRILASGNYNKKGKLLIVSDVQDLEILSTTPQPIPTSTPTSKPTPIITPSPIPTNIPTTTPTVIPAVTPSPEG